MMLLLLLASCSERARIIPQGKMAKIYAEMFVADQWVMVNPAVRKQADTSLFYEPIFRKYGYTFKDYNASVEHYLLDPDTYVKILTQTSQILDSRLEQARSLKEIEDGAKAFNARIRGYENRDFSDSLAWKPLLEAWRKEASARRLLSPRTYIYKGGRQSGFKANPLGCSFIPLPFSAQFLNIP